MEIKHALFAVIAVVLIGSTAAFAAMSAGKTFPQTTAMAKFPEVFKGFIYSEDDSKQTAVFVTLQKPGDISLFERSFFLITGDEVKTLTLEDVKSYNGITVLKFDKGTIKILYTRSGFHMAEGKLYNGQRLVMYEMQQAGPWLRILGTSEKSEVEEVQEEKINIQASGKTR